MADLNFEFIMVFIDCTHAVVAIHLLGYRRRVFWYIRVHRATFLRELQCANTEPWRRLLGF